MELDKIMEYTFFRIYWIACFLISQNELERIEENELERSQEK